MSAQLEVIRAVNGHLIVEPLWIKSARDGFELILGPPERQGGEGSFPVKLIGPAMSVSVNVYEHGYHFLPRFFDDLAREWRGWAGEKTWESVEFHIALRATADRVGHVFLRVTLRDIDAPAAWRAEATLLIEAGQLDALPGSARRVFGVDV
jgi:hypothetical protein